MAGLLPYKEMLSIVNIYIVLLLLLFKAPQAFSKNLCVNASHEDVDECLISEEKCCKTLEFLIANTAQGNDFNIKVLVLGRVKVSGVIRIEGFQNLTITGDNNSSKLLCDASSNQTGIYIRNVHGLALTDLIIENCSMLQKSLSSQMPQKTLYAVYIINCSDLTVNRTTISHNNGRGLAIYDTNGTVQIIDSNFTNNTVPEGGKFSGGGGLRIEFTDRALNNTQIANAYYTIQDSMFTSNYAYSIDVAYSRRNEYMGLGRGGGFTFIMRGNSSRNQLHIINCAFVNNSASAWGGGLDIYLRDDPTSNNISVMGSEFTDNNCKCHGGGGVKITLLSYDGGGVPTENTITFKRCNFTANTAATLGGGVLLVSTRENQASNIESQLNNVIQFISCTWLRNRAKFGSAIDIYPAIWDVLGNGVLPVPSFQDCSFIENIVTEQKKQILDHPGIVKTTTGVGTMLISNFAVDFKGSMVFTDNEGTAVYLQSGIVNVTEGTEVTFNGNSARTGGAIALYAFSVVYLLPNTTITFSNNTASFKGGAIYAESMDQHESFTSRSCFFQADNDENNENDTIPNRSIVFEANSARSNFGNSIYATSIHPCCSKDKGYFSCIAKVRGLETKDITTSLNTLKYNNETKSNLSNVVPGKYFSIPIDAYDELNKSVNITYDATMKDNSSVWLDTSPLNYLSNTKLRVHSNGTVESNTLLLNYARISLSINITTLECPPGHLLDRNETVCRCDTSKFEGIWKCNRSRRVASIISGFWIGLCNSQSGEQCTGHCPAGFCTYNASTDLAVRIENTHELLCTKNRKGRLCGKCIKNTSVFYHSFNYACGSNALCKYGVLFYLLSEILPLTIIFIVIIMCNISFTTGAVNGIIFYAQIFDSFIINFYNIVDFPKPIVVLTDIYRFVFTTTNLNYFSLEKLSFCFWEGATTLDIIAMKYVTIVYALLLIIATVLLLNTVTCKKLCICWRPHNLKNAVIHGFSAFLVMCYSQCAMVSFMLLTPTQLTGYGHSPNEQVVFFSGEHNLFDRKHLMYAIPAIFFMISVVIIPPLSLLLYPLSFKILALCHMSELRVVNWISNRIPVQLFDSFQSCYKDNFRFFSGLYFLYRVIPLLLYAINSALVDFYFMVEIFLIVALALNAVLQPYKKHCHNVTDTLIFTNLAIINAISLYNYQRVNEGKEILDTIKKILMVSRGIQLALIYFPLVYILLWSLWHVVTWIRKRAKERKISKLDYSREVLLDSQYLPPLRESSSYSVTDIDQEFHEMK